ncbi:MAG: Smr/MutS family protein [Candidatus Cardinium sp.]
MSSFRGLIYLVFNILDMPISIGSYVRIKNQTTIGEVVDIRLDKVLISVGNLYFYLPFQSVEHVDHSPSMPTKAKQPNIGTMCPPSMQTDPMLDLHGFNKAQALLALEKFLDRSLLLGHSRLKIIHGQGKGILRNAIRDYLSNHPLVKSITLQSPIHCMAGMTLIEI